MLNHRNELQLTMQEDVNVNVNGMSLELIKQSQGLIEKNKGLKRKMNRLLYEEMELKGKYNKQVEIENDIINNKKENVVCKLEKWLNVINDKIKELHKRSLDVEIKEYIMNQVIECSKQQQCSNNNGYNVSCGKSRNCCCNCNNNNNNSIDNNNYNNTITLSKSASMNNIKLSKAKEYDMKVLSQNKLLKKVTPQKQIKHISKQQPWRSIYYKSPSQHSNNITPINNTNTNNNNSTLKHNSNNKQHINTPSLSKNKSFTSLSIENLSITYITSKLNNISPKKITRNISSCQLLKKTPSHSLSSFTNSYSNNDITESNSATKSNNKNIFTKGINTINKRNIIVNNVIHDLQERNKKKKEKEMKAAIIPKNPLYKDVKSRVYDIQQKGNKFRNTYNNNYHNRLMKKKINNINHNYNYILHEEIDSISLPKTILSSIDDNSQQNKDEILTNIEIKFQENSFDKDIDNNSNNNSNSNE